MAIEFNCPNCLYPYKLKDEFAGKRATCKNPDCRRIIVIPKPEDLLGNHLASAADLEAAALSALNEEPSVAREQEPAEQVIAMTCSVCEHKWTEPFSKAGKNTLCPNPECRQRIKVPEPKTDEPHDWRQTKTKLPSGAKQHFEKLEGVEDAAEAKTVAGESLRQAGATGIEIEPRTLKEKTIIGLTIFGVFAALALGIWYLSRSRSSGLDDRLLQEARAGFEDCRKELAPNNSALFSAVLNNAAGEYALRHNTPKKLEEAHNLYGNSRRDMDGLPPGYEKHALATELALAVTNLGGSDEQVKEEIRFRWQPDLAMGRLKINVRTYTVHNELRNSLDLLKDADFEFRMVAARRLTRELVKKGQASLAADIIPLVLFADSEKDEAKAVIGLELYRLDKDSDVVGQIAEELRTKKVEELKAAKGNNWGTPYSPSAYTLFAVKSMELPGFGEPLPVRGELNESIRTAHVGISLLQGNAEEAQNRALRTRDPVSQLRSLVLCAEWMANPTPALETAQQLISSVKGKRDVILPQSLVLRLSQIAAYAGMTGLANSIASALNDDGLKAWALGDAAHLALVSNPKLKLDPSTIERPDEEKQVKVGHIWGLYWIARRAAAESGNRNAEKKVVDGWSAPIRPFGLAGIALGLQDR